MSRGNRPPADQSECPGCARNCVRKSAWPRIITRYRVIYRGMSIRDYQVAALDRSSLMTAIGHRVTLIKGGRTSTAPFFFRFGRSSDHGVRQKNRSGMIPARTLRVASVPRICIWSGVSYWRDIHPPLSPYVAFFSLPFSLVSYRGSPPCLSTVDTPVAASRSPRHSGVAREEGEGPPSLPGRPNFNRAYKSFE